MDLLASFGITDIFGHLGVDRFATKLQVKAAYKKLAIKLHPDKTNGKTDIEFKLLALCYKECLKQIIDCDPIPMHSELKAASEKTEEVAYARNFYSTNFDDAQTRQEIFVDDDMDYQKFEEMMKRTQSGSTTYTADSLYNKSIYQKLKSSNGKFDREKFNAYFLQLKKEGKIGKELVKVEKVMPYSNNTYMEVNMHDDMIINLDPEKRKGNYIDLMQTGEIKTKDINELLSMDQTKVNKLIKESKINTGKLAKNKIKEKINSRVEIPVDTKYTFHENLSRLEQDAANRILASRERQKEVVDKYKHVYNLAIAAPSKR